jgi:tetratricopeptide (TPR) repeat protein
VTGKSRHSRKTDLQRSFKAAAYHMFRQMHNGPELACNPIVQRLVQNQNSSKLKDLVRAYILKEAWECRCEDLEERKEHQANRLYAIVVAICNCESVVATYNRLALSRRQYYRDRRSIIIRISTRLARRSRRTTSRAYVASSLDLLLMQTSALKAMGLAKKASALLHDALAASLDARSRVAICLELADVALALGEEDKAGALLDDVTRLPKALNERHERELEDRATLLRARFDEAIGRSVEAGDLLDALVRRHTLENSSHRIVAQTLIESAYFQCARSRYAQANKLVQKLRPISSEGMSSAEVRAQVLLLRAHCLGGDSTETDHALETYEDAIQFSRENRLIQCLLEATMGTAVCFHAIGHERLVYDRCASALEIARCTEGSQLLRTTAAWISALLIQTSYWRTTGPLLFETEALMRPGSRQWIILKTAQGHFLTRLGQHQKARAVLEHALSAARQLDNRPIEASVCRDLAVSLVLVGLNTESCDMVRQAVALAESGARAGSLGLTYRVAAKILRDPRYARLAESLGSSGRTEYTETPAIWPVVPALSLNIKHRFK